MTVKSLTQVGEHKEKMVLKLSRVIIPILTIQFVIRQDQPLRQAMNLTHSFRLGPVIVRIVRC